MALSPTRTRRNTCIPTTYLAKVLRHASRHPVVRQAWELEWLDVRWDEDPIPVVYALIDTLDPDVYFGQTCNAYKRRLEHDRQLRRGEHKN